MLSDKMLAVYTICKLAIVSVLRDHFLTQQSTRTTCRLNNCSQGRVSDVDVRNIIFLILSFTDWNDSFYRIKLYLVLLLITVLYYFIRMLIKRAQGRSRLGFKNFRKRFFVLTNKGLSYSKDKTKPVVGHIPVCDILGAESLGEDSFHLKLVGLFYFLNVLPCLLFDFVLCCPRPELS